jgi:hypothetical protein
MARAHLVGISVTRWHHCITRRARRAFLLADGPENRKERIERRLQEHSEIFAIAVCSNHARKLRVPRIFDSRLEERKKPLLKSITMER